MYVQAGMDIGKWDCESLYLRSPTNSHRWPQSLPYFSDAKTLTGFFRSFAQWTEPRLVVSHVSSVPPNGAATCSILKKPLLSLPNISAAWVAPETMARCYSNHPILSNFSLIFFVCLFVSDLDQKKNVSWKLWEADLVWSIYTLRTTYSMGT